MRGRKIAVSIFILSLSIVSTTFVLLTLTSNDWAIQEYYAQPNGVGDSDWKNPLCVARRSPYYKCDWPQITEDPDDPLNWTCTVPNCKWYKPYGNDQTSCSLPVESGNDLGQNPSKQECQEVHYAGNLQIAASCFITFSLVILLALTATNILLAVLTRDPQPVDNGEERRKHEGSQQAHEHVPRSERLRRSPAAPYLTLSLVICLCAGAACQFIAQFFGVLGLTVNATPTPAYFQFTAGEIWGTNAWIMSKALTVYATVAWTTSIGCAGLITGYSKLV